MTEISEPGRSTPLYDRDFLLSPAKRNQVMALWEVEKFGIDCFGDPDYVSIYGLRPAEWYVRGVRLLARTTLEAVRDRLGAMIGQDVARRVATVPAGTPFGVIDPFAGSCNGLYWVLRHVPNATVRGFELDETVFALTSRNLALLHQDERPRGDRARTNALAGLRDQRGRRRAVQGRDPRA